MTSWSRTLAIAGIALIASCALFTGAATRGTAAPVAKPAQQIAFTRSYVRGRWDVSHLFVINADGSGLRQLTHGNAVDGAWSSSWAPDGRRIVFTRWLKGRGRDVFVVNADGNGLRRLTHDGSSSLPDWSPDGQTIVYTGPGALFLVKPDGGDDRALTVPTTPKSPSRPTAGWWSPDGQTITYTTARGQIYVINADGSEQRRIMDGLPGGAYTCPAWSPDGRTLAFVSIPPLEYDSIYVADVETGVARLLTRHAYTESGFAWSPDGQRLVYAREKSRGVYSINVDGSGDRRLTSNSVRRDFSVGGFGYSPDGRKITYASDRTGGGDLYVMSSDGSGQSQLTSGPEVDGAPSWSSSPYTGSC